MQEGRPSRTAFGAALYRAVHATLSAIASVHGEVVFDYPNPRPGQVHRLADRVAAAIGDRWFGGGGAGSRKQPQRPRGAGARPLEPAI